MVVPRLCRFDLWAERRSSPGRQEGLRIELAKNLDEEGDDASPTRLVAGADAGAVVAMEIFVEQQVIAPVGILLEFLRSTEHRPPAGFIAQEDPGQAIGDLLCDLV